MSTLVLKIVACVTMLLDHIGYRLYEVPALREIGRIAFPLFAFMVAVGASKTRNIYRYLLRLVLFGFGTEIFSDLYFYGTWRAAGHNVMFTLALGLLGIVCYRESKFTSWKALLGLVPTVFLGLLANSFGTDYGAFGVWLVVLFYVFSGEKKSDKVMTGVVCTAFAARYPIVFAVKYVVNAGFSVLNPSGRVPFPTLKAPTLWEWTQLYAAFALLYIFLYNGKRGPDIQSRPLRRAIQYAFYAFYPVHLLILWLILVK